MSKIRLTDLTVKSLPPGTYLDDKLAGFGIRIGKTRRTWTATDPASRIKITLGHYPVLSLADARKKALIALGSPLAEKQTAPRFPDARAEYLAQGKWRPRSLYVITNTLTRHFNWTKPIDQISHTDITNAINAIPHPSEAWHAFKDIRAFFNWCVPRYLKSSPCQGLKSPSKYIPRTRVLSDTEIIKVWAAAADLGTFGLMIRCCICTGLRIGELTKLRPEWIDGHTLAIPADAAKNGRPSRIPLSKTQLNLLVSLSLSSRSPIQGKQKKRLDLHSSVTGWTIHDLRRTYATNMQRLGVRLEVTERLLNHISGTQSGIAGIYQRHSFEEEMREAVNRYERFLLDLLAKQH